MTTRGPPVDHAVSFNRLHNNAGLFLGCFLPFGPLFRPSRLCGSPERLAAFLGTDVPPACGPQAYRRSLNRRRRELSTRKIQHFDGQIEQGLGGQAGLTHHAPKTRRAPCAQEARQLIC